MKKTIIEIEIDKIKADEYYFYFNYKVIVNGKEKLNDSYSGDYDGGDVKEIKKILKDGYAESLVLEDFGNELFHY